jgi:uncharacterized membrane protein
MADADPEQDEFIEHLRQYVWAGVPTIIIIVLTKALIARYPEVDVIWLFLAVAIPVIAVAYAFAFWWRKRHA